MDHATPSYDPRYLAGVVLFNRGDFFEAHEVWESLWMETSGPEKPFLQGLIQAAVGLCHYCNGNARGAAKLYHSSRGYMERFGPVYWGLDQQAFWRDMHACFLPVLGENAIGQRVEIDEELIPTMAIEPPPPAWPDPAAYLDAEESHP